MRGSDFAELEAFSAVAVHGSFVKAAAFLGLSTSTLSQAVRALEARLGQSLFNRTTRRVALTVAGGQLFRQVRPAIAELRMATRSLQALRDKPVGHIRLSVSNVPAVLLVAPVMADFLAQNPGITLEVTVDDSTRDIIEGRFDAGIRHSSRIGLEMAAVPVTRKAKTVVLASPAYLSRHGTPGNPQELQQHRCVRMRMADGSFFRWLFDNTGTSLEISVSGPLIVNSVDLLVRAALDGIGLIYLSEDYAAPFVAQGLLVPLLSEWSPLPSEYFLYYVRKRDVTPSLQALIHFLVQRLDAQGGATG